jgi:hypothetical protein
MKVRELIRKLEQLDPELPVFVRMLNTSDEHIGYYLYTSVEDVGPEDCGVMDYLPGVAIRGG